MPILGLLRQAARVITREFQRGYGKGTGEFLIAEPSDFDSLTPYEFEHYIAQLWESKGYRTELTSGGGDQGIDVIARRGGEAVVIQAKLYSEGQSVGSSTVRNVSGAAVQFGAERAVLVTTTGYTEPAQEAASDTGVELINGTKLMRLVREHQRGSE